MEWAVREGATRDIELLFRPNCRTIKLRNGLSPLARAAGVTYRLPQGLHQPHGVHALLSWLLRRVFPSAEPNGSADDAAQPTRYIDEKRAKAIKQAALFAEFRRCEGCPSMPSLWGGNDAPVGQAGDHSGSRFWGCTEYPTCKATRKA